MYIGMPQIIMITLLIIKVTDYYINDGKDKVVKRNFGCAVFAFIAYLGLLYWGGFFHEIQ